MFINLNNYLDTLSLPPSGPAADWDLIKHLLVKEHELDYVTEERLFTPHQFTEYLRLLLTLQKYPQIFVVKKEDRGIEGFVMSLYKPKEEHVL